ncbi:MAG: AAA family ATPase [Alphaproteobacteria bacterium]|nr:AAA family ATPase [Alphaproteobacteria bacterium]
MSAIPMVETLSPADWHGKPVPPRRWLVPGLLIRGKVTMLSGHGGVGKSLLVQQLATALATAQPFLGIAPVHEGPVRSLALFCEDDADELHFRQTQINAHYGCAMPDLAPMTIMSRVGEDNCLMSFDRNDRGEETPLYRQIEHLIRAGDPSLVIIDTSADTFAGNENVRIHVRQFIAALTRLARINDGCILLNAHPSLVGMNSGSGLSGNTAWHNSVRGRLYLTRPKGAEGAEEEVHSDERFLKTMKSNYGPMGEQLKLRWHEHVFVNEDTARGPISNALDRAELDSAVIVGLRRLVDDGELIPASSQANNGLAVRLGMLPECRRWDWATLTNAKERLVAQGRIARVRVGRGTRSKVCLRPIGMTLPGEVSVVSPAA